MWFILPLFPFQSKKYIPEHIIQRGRLVHRGLGVKSVRKRVNDGDGEYDL